MKHKIVIQLFKNKGKWLHLKDKEGVVCIESKGNVEIVFTPENKYFALKDANESNTRIRLFPIGKG